MPCFSEKTETNHPIFRKTENKPAESNNRVLAMIKAF